MGSYATDTDTSTSPWDGMAAGVPDHRCAQPRGEVDHEGEDEAWRYGLSGRITLTQVLFYHSNTKVPGGSTCIASNSRRVCHRRGRKGGISRL